MTRLLPAIAVLAFTLPAYADPPCETRMETREDFGPVYADPGPTDPDTEPSDTPAESLSSGHDTPGEPEIIGYEVIGTTDVPVHRTGVSMGNGHIIWSSGWRDGAC